MPGLDNGTRLFLTNVGQHKGDFDTLMALMGFDCGSHW